MSFTSLKFWPKKSRIGGFENFRFFESATIKFFAESPSTSGAIYEYFMIIVVFSQKPPTPNIFEGSVAKVKGELKYSL